MLKGITPTINQAYAMIVEDEIQHLTCVAVTQEKSNPIAMQVNRTLDNNHIKAIKERSVIIAIILSTLEKIAIS